VCETGGGRRAWLRGQTNVSKAHTLKCAAYNLGLLLRKVWGYCKPRSSEAAAALLFAFSVLLVTGTFLVRPFLPSRFSWLQSPAHALLVTFIALAIGSLLLSSRKNRHFLTGC